MKLAYYAVTAPKARLPLQILSKNEYQLKSYGLIPLFGTCSYLLWTRYKRSLKSFENEAVFTNIVKNK